VPPANKEFEIIIKQTAAMEIEILLYINCTSLEHASFFMFLKKNSFQVLPRFWVYLGINLSSAYPLISFLFIFIHYVKKKNKNNSNFFYIILSQP